jgi:plastocyanin
MIGMRPPRSFPPNRRTALAWGALGAALVLVGLPSAQASEAGVMINNRMFSPSEVTVSVGDTVTWTNTSDEDHSVRGGPFGSAVLHPGNHYSFTFSRAETVKYTCDIHPTMKGTVTVR